MDRNGYNPSILATEDGVCMLCGLCTDTARHEIFYGTGERSLSKRYGLWVNLCHAATARYTRTSKGSGTRHLKR